MRYFLSTRNEPILSDGLFYTAQLAGKVQMPVEDDHFLIWVNVEQAAGLLFHEHHSWAVRRAAFINHKDGLKKETHKDEHRST